MRILSSWNPLFLPLSGASRQQTHHPLALKGLGVLDVYPGTPYRLAQSSQSIRPKMVQTQSRQTREKLWVNRHRCHFRRNSLCETDPCNRFFTVKVSLYEKQHSVPKTNYCSPLLRREFISSWSRKQIFMRSSTLANSRSSETLSFLKLRCHFLVHLTEISQSRLAHHMNVWCARE